jgi:hypothetical protein
MSDKSNTPINKKRTRKSESSNSPSPITQPQKLTRKMDSSFSASGVPEDQNEAMRIFIKNVIQESERRTKTLITELKKDVREIGELASKVEQTEQAIQGIYKDFGRMEADKRKNNIIIYGMDAKEKESWKDIEELISSLAAKLGIAKIDYNNAFRLGKLGTKRPIKIELMRFRDKQEIMSKSSALKGTNVSINDDLTPMERKARALLRAKRKQLQETLPSAHFTLRNEFLLVRNGKDSRKFILDKDMRVIESRHDGPFQGPSRIHT